MSLSGRPRALLVGTVVLLASALVLTSCGGSATKKDESSAYAVDAASGVRVVAVGDIACAPDGEVSATTCQQARTAELTKSLDPAMVLTLGDHQYEHPSKQDFMDSYDKSWGSLWKITRPTPGNHEYYDTGAAGYYDYFEGRQPGPPGYYRVTAKGWQIYVLNSNCDKIDCTAEAAWLDAEMRSHPSTCSLVTMHHPRYSSGSEHGNDLGVRGLWGKAFKHRTDIALAGHDHDYERFVRKDGSGHIRARRGITSFVVGTGGKNMYQLGQRKSGSAYFQADTPGVLLLELKAKSYTWSFKDINGKIRDSGARRCF